MSNVVDLEEVSNTELLSDVDGSISLSDVSDEKSDDNLDADDGEEDEFSDIDKTSTSSEEEEGEDVEVEEEDPWVMMDADQDEIASSKDPLVKLSDDDDEDGSDYDDDELKKIEKSTNKELLMDCHPEVKQINYKELNVLTKITRDQNAIIIDPLHTTLPILTRYEKTKILGLRAKQINNGSPLFINVKRDIIDGHVIALLELEQKKIPFIIRRPLPNGRSEYWNIKDLEYLN
jgi:DNA-directed RNA polymerase subunit K/omega